MQLSLLITGLAVAVASVHADCPTRRMEHHVIKQAMDHEAIKRDSPVARDNIDVNTYLHNVATGPTYDEAYVSDDLLQEQFDVIYEKFLPYGIEMHLAGIDHIINKAWANNTVFSQTEADMKNALHKGNYADINMYIVDELYYPDPENDTTMHIDFKTVLCPVNGFSHFPVSGVTFLSGFITDGIVITYRAVSGSNKTGRDMGLTAVHEIGHWFGLEHTFVRQCEGLGDGIADTPVEDVYTLEGSNNVCPEGRDTCPGQEGLDPIHNYMDTTSDQCRYEFTPGQVERMHTLFKLLRLPKVP